MKLLIIHNFHRKGSASGDDLVFKNEVEILKSKGIEVLTYSVSNDEFDQKSPLGKVFSTFEMLWSFKNYRKVKEIIEREDPDLVHVHTFFPLLSPSILYAAKKKGKKVVATLHDTRFICPCATSLRNGRICNLCGDGKYFRMAKYGCFKNSRLQSLIVAFIFKYHRILKSFYKKIDKYICLNDNQIALLKEIGFDEEKIVKKYNFITDNAKQAESKHEYELPKRYATFFGRIGEEKGIRNLMKIFDHISDIDLVVMGDGPLKPEFLAWCQDKPNIKYLGYVKHDKCIDIVQKAQFVIFPSIWYEGCSMVVVEAESLGKPLIATDIGFTSEAIIDGYNGYKVKLNDIDGFVAKIKELWQKPDLCHQMGQNARLDYEAKYQPEDNVKQLIDIYRSLL